MGGKTFDEMSEATRKLSVGLRQIAKDLDAVIEKQAGERIAFTLIVFTEGRASYVSTCERRDSVREMSKLLDLWAKGMPDIKAHEVM